MTSPMPTVPGRPASHMSRQKQRQAKLELLGEAALAWDEARRAGTLETDDAPLCELLESISDYRHVRRGLKFG